MITRQMLHTMRASHDPLDRAGHHHRRLQRQSGCEAGGRREFGLRRPRACWLLGLVMSCTQGGFIHLLLGLANAVVRLRVIGGRKAL
jgi:hypothetical protein